MFETLTKQQLNSMTSEEYKQHFQGPDGDAFRKRTDELDAQPATRRAVNNVRGAEPAPASGFDPSFDSDEPAPVTAPVVAEPIAAQPTSAVEPVLAIWEYQPQDAQGRAVGGLQRFKYDPSLPVDDPKSLVSQLTKAHSSATTALKQRRTQAVIESVKEVATAYQEPTFLDPKLYPNAEAVNELSRNAIANGTLSALNLFKQSHPDFVLGDENAAAMVGWVSKSKRNPSDSQTWELAWEALKPYLAAPVAEVSAPTPAPVAAAAAVTVAPAPVRHAAVATGLSDIDGSSENIRPETANAGQNQGWTHAKIEALPTEQYRKIVRDPRMAQLFDRVLQAHEDKRAAARRGR